MAPAGLQCEIVNRINADVKTIMARTEVQNRIAQIGLDSQATSPEVLADTIRNDMTRWGKVIREAKVKLTPPVACS